MHLYKYTTSQPPISSGPVSKKYYDEEKACHLIVCTYFALFFHLF